jgi:ankyrin repeat protein
MSEGLMRALWLAVCGAALAVVADVALAAEALVADAAEAGEAATIRTLIEEKSSVNAPQADGMTALHWATYHDDEEMVSRLLAAGADPKAANRYQVSPLALACTNGNVTIVKLLLDAGADANVALPGGETALMTAARTGKIGPVGELLARGATVDSREHKGQTALMWAAAEGHVEVVDALLKAGAEFRKPLPSGFTPLFFAVREGRTSVVMRLLDAGLEINDPSRPEQTGGGPRRRATSPLLLAVENGHFDLAAALLDRGADPNQKPAGFAALHAITWVRKPIRGDGDPPPIGSGTMGSLEFVRRLVAKGADVNIRLEKGQSGPGRFTTTGSTPFVLAARASDVALLRLLVEQKADPRLSNADDCTALLAATGVGSLENGDETAGTEEEAIETVKYLLELGADINAVDKNGESAMHGAVYQDFAKMVPFLAEHGADIAVWNRKNKSGWTPLLIAYGYRPGNFRPEPDSIAAVERVMRSAGVTPPPRPKEPANPKQY